MQKVRFKFVTLASFYILLFAAASMALVQAVNASNYSPSQSDLKFNERQSVISVCEMYALKTIGNTKNTIISDQSAYRSKGKWIVNIKLTEQDKFMRNYISKMECIITNDDSVPALEIINRVN